LPSDASSLFAAARAQSAAGRDLEARLALAAGLHALADPGLVPVVVGGTAVDFYAARTTPSGLEPSRILHASQDVDIIVLGAYTGAGRLRALLDSSGEFERNTHGIPVEQTRQWWFKGAPMLVEVLSGDLAGDPERVVLVDVEGGEAVLWGPEDTVWHYAQSALATTSASEWERAVILRHVQDLDWDYMRTLPDALAPATLVDALQAEETFDEMLWRVHEARRRPR
jgi:hypothetical protein